MRADPGIEISFREQGDDLMSLVTPAKCWMGNNAAIPESAPREPRVIGLDLGDVVPTASWSAEGNVEQEHAKA